jgi:hypothetical protein
MVSRKRLEYGLYPPWLPLVVNHSRAVTDYLSFFAFDIQGYFSPVRKCFFDLCLYRCGSRVKV